MTRLKRFAQRTLAGGLQGVLVVSAASAQFNAPEVLVTGAGPLGTTLHDVTGDGILDILTFTGASTSSELRLSVGAPDGSFGPLVELALFGGTGRVIRSGDMDGDGLEDVVVAVGSAVYVLDQQPGGSFSLPRSIYSGDVTALDLLDMDGDSDPDLLAGTTVFPSQPSAVLLNEGPGPFTVVPLSGTAGDTTTAIFGGDFDGDGDIDVVRSALDMSDYHENDGALVFSESSIEPSSISTYGIADVDGDGDLDVTYSGLIATPFGWVENRGGGAFGPPIDIEPFSVAISAPGAADFDGDGVLDLLLVEDLTRRVSWYRGLGGGAFGPAIVIDDEAPVAALAFVGDVDGDLDMDFVISSQTSNEIVLYRNGTTLGASACKALPNSSGNRAAIELSGSSSRSANLFHVRGSGFPPGTLGILIAGQTQGTSTPAGSAGLLCLDRPYGLLNRMNEILPMGTSGGFTRQVDLSTVPGGNPTLGVGAGETWAFQTWFRDLNPALTSNFSEAIEITFVR